MECGAMDGAAALDLVFVCDCTGSMGSYLAATQQNIHSVCRCFLLSHTIIFFSPPLSLLLCWHAVLKTTKNPRKNTHTTTPRVV